MGMFDMFYPSPPLHCPVCRRVLEGWQSKEAESRMYRITQGVSGAVDDWDGENHKVDDYPLPEEFIIYTDCMKCDMWFDAYCESVDGVWSRVTSLSFGARR